MTIIVSTPDGETTRLEETGVESEDELQRYIYENPECLPLDAYKEGNELLILGREVPTETGPIDALGVDPDGEVYLIETKLYQNRDKRQVLAQVLDYGASLWATYPDPTELIDHLRSQVSEKFGTTLERKLEEGLGLGETEWNDFLSSLRANVGEGRFRFVILMDRIEDPLKDVIRFVNRNSRFDIFGVELEFYRYGDLHILAPELYGAEVEKRVDEGSRPDRKRWDRESYFKDARRRLDRAELEAIEELFAWAEEWSDQISWGTGSRRGSFNPQFDAVHPTRSIFTVYSDGELVLRFGWLGEREESRAFVERFGNSLRRRIEDLPVPSGPFHGHVQIPVEDWSDHVAALIEVVEEALPEEETR